MNAVWIIASTALATIVAVILTTNIVRKKDRKKIEFLIDAMEDEDFNVKFIESNKYNITLNRMKWIVERQRIKYEQDSWTKLLRVMTHEIMNTVSPIASLSDALYQDIESKNVDEIKDSLETISSSSKNLITFIESYREMAGIARPAKKAIMLKPFIENIIDLTSEQCDSANARCSCHFDDDDILIFADESQISRIFINLIKNAIQAEASLIHIEAEINQHEHTIIHVTNNGIPIPEECREQIFIPFFTTKNNGNGIGLSLSRQIMRAHNGSLELYDNKRFTEFIITFR